EQALLMQGIDKVDAAVVGIGRDFEASALATVLLKQLGVPRIVSRAVSRISARILARIGADEVVNPEDESADRWANRLISPQFLRQFELDEGHSLVEIVTPRKWVGQTLAKLNLRARAGLHVVAIRRPPQAETGRPALLRLPSPEEPLGERDVLVIMGRDADLARLPRD
ncbi:MAG TPA: TrkA family potassium uptake protein, partial [Phycisphaeraceae bacterium]